jgi:phosphoadenosine phosphosulfate reductase
MSSIETMPRSESPSIGALSASEIEAANQRLEGRPAAEIVRWAADRFGSGLCLAASMADTVLVDVAVGVDPDIEVVFLDTGFHFAETLGTLRRVMQRHALRVTVLRPDLAAPTRLPDPWTDGPEACCRARKGEPLDALLAGRAAWMTGLRRADSPERAETAVVELDRRGLIKVNPLVAWSDDDVDRYVAEHDPVANPLLFGGYPSIGCWPCTEPAGPDDARAGRWAGTGKTECGIHL